MAKKKTTKRSGTDDMAALTFKRGVDLAGGRRFEAGEPVPDDLDVETREALEQLDAFFVTGEKEI